MAFKDNTFLFLYWLNHTAQGSRDGHTGTDVLYHHGTSHEGTENLSKL